MKGFSHTEQTIRSCIFKRFRDFYPDFPNIPIPIAAAVESSVVVVKRACELCVTAIDFDIFSKNRKLIAHREFAAMFLARTLAASLRPSTAAALSLSRNAKSVRTSLAAVHTSPLSRTGNYCTEIVYH